MFLLMLHFFSGIRIKIHAKEILMSHFSLKKGQVPYHLKHIGWDSKNIYLGNR